MRKLFIMAWLSITSLPIFAVDYDAIIDNLYYKFNGSTASVVGCTNIQDFSGAYQLTDGNSTFWVVDIVIPSTITKNSTTYIVTSISSGAFSTSNVRGGSLHSVVIPNSVTYIGEGAFRWQYYLESINIPEGISSIEKNAFCGLGISSIVLLPSSLTYIGEGAFESCRNLQNVIIPQNVYNIDNAAFYNCENLTSIQFPTENLRYIGERAFHNSGLTHVEIPSSVRSIGREAFSYTKLKNISITNPNCGIDDRAFAYTPLENATIASAGQYMFLGVSDIETKTKNLTITLLDGMTWIPDYAFTQTDIENINIPASVVSLGQGAFWYCKDLKTITFDGNNISEIPDMFLSGCDSLEDIIIPEGVSNIGEYVFRECRNLKKIEFPSTLTHIGRGNFNYNHEEDTNLDVYIPNLSQWFNIDFARNEYGDFDYSNPLSKSSNFYVNNEKLSGILTIPSDIYDLKLDALGLAINNLSGIEIPYSVQSVKHPITVGDSLKWIKMESQTPPALDYYNFYGITLLVPCGCIRAYRDAENWKEFYNIWDIPYYYELSVNRDFIIDDYYDLGSVDIQQKPTCDNNYMLIIKAYPRNGYHFSQWSDGIIDNPRTIQLTNHTYLTAEFAEGAAGIEDIHFDATTPHKIMIDGQIYIFRNDKTYTLQGQEVK